MALQLDWRQIAPDDLARQAAQVLADGGNVLLPSDIGPVIAADPAQLVNPCRPNRLADNINVCRFDGYVDALAVLARRDGSPIEYAMASRLWPGAIAWQDNESPFPAWAPSHSAVTRILAAYGSPLALFELIDAPADLGEAIALEVADGQSVRLPMTIIRVNGAQWSIVREGSTSADAIRLALARRIVFVCTGNTCRSPMAEAIFKKRLADWLGCSIDSLIDHGYAITSVGLSAYGGDAAADDAVATLRDFGIDLSGHRSRAATADNIAQADDLIAMTCGHLVSILNRYPTLAGSLRLLCGVEGDLDDPIARGSEVYRACADTITRHVDRLLLEMGLS